MHYFEYGTPLPPTASVMDASVGHHFPTLASRCSTKHLLCSFWKNSNCSNRQSGWYHLYVNIGEKVNRRLLVLGMWRSSILLDYSLGGISGATWVDFITKDFVRITLCSWEHGTLLSVRSATFKQLSSNNQRTSSQCIGYR